MNCPATKASEYLTLVFRVGRASTCLPRMYCPGTKNIETNICEGRGYTSVLSAGRSAICCSITGPLNFLHAPQLFSFRVKVLWSPINQNPACRWHHAQSDDLSGGLVCSSDMLLDRQHGFSLASEWDAFLQTLK